MRHLNFVQQGQGPMVVLSHALGCDLSMWNAVAAALEDRYTVLRYDHRGHGRSPASADTYTIEDLADDAAELIRSQAVGPVHFVGLSLGGMAAQSLGARYPRLVRSLVIANSASRYDDAARAMWQTRITTVLTQGVPSIAAGAMQRWFTPEFHQHEQAQVTALRAVLEATSPDLYAAACGAVSKIDLDTSNGSIVCPTLVIAGSSDEATPPVLSEGIARRIPGAQLRFLDAAHLSAVERPDAFARLLTEFWAGLPA